MEKVKKENQIKEEDVNQYLSHVCVILSDIRKLIAARFASYSFHAQIKGYF